jgi:anthranilate/para-aminobenzoate synthase component I
MARRSSYQTYVDYYKQYTQGGRKAAEMLTEDQFEVSRKRYYKSGQNVSRRIASDQMELSSKQLRAATRLMREAQKADILKSAYKAAEFGKAPGSIGTGTGYIEKYRREQDRNIKESERSIERAKTVLSSEKAPFEKKQEAREIIENAKERMEAARAAIDALERLREVKEASFSSKSTADEARKLSRNEFKKNIEDLRLSGYSHSGISALLGSPDEETV